MTVTSTFNAYGKPLTQSTPYASGETPYYTTTTYDALGRPDLVTAPDGTQTDYIYNGLTTSVTDANGHTHTTVADILGRTRSVTPPTGPGIVFDYDDLGNLKTAERGGATVTMSYDLGGRKIAMADPDMGSWTYDYDALGNLKVQTDARGCTLSMNYDLLNRLDTKNSSGTCGQHVNVDYNYDESAYGIGFRTSMADGTSTHPTSWNYDARGRLVKETKWIDSQSFVTEWGYNSADLPVTMTYPDDEIVTTEYDNRMLPISVSGNENYVPSMDYDSAGRMTAHTLGNGLTQKYLYKAWTTQGGGLDKIVAGSGTWNDATQLFTNTLQKSSYTYDNVGNITQIAQVVDFGNNQTETQSYTYDALNRLTGWTLDNNPTESYSYDAAGNLDVKNNQNLDYLDPNHVHAVTHVDSTRKYWYDENGNQIVRIYGPDTYTQIYDAENRMTEVQKNGVTMARFTYDGNGQRIKSVMDNETILFIGGYYEQKGNEITKYYPGGAMRKYEVPVSMNVEYILGDHLGSASVMTDSNGNKVSEMRYSPWGQVRYHWVDSNLSTTPAYTLPKKSFTGQYSYMDDPSTSGVDGFGLMFYNSRFYDPAIGRFAQADSIVAGGVQGFDRYAYVGNNPTVYTDPSGHFRTDPGDGGSSRAGGNGGGPGTEPGFSCDGHGFGERAYKMCQKYLGLRNHPGGGWWNDYGHATFTLWDFINMLLRMEIHNDVSEGMAQELAVRNMYDTCTNNATLASNGCNPSNPIDVLNYLAFRNIVSEHKDANGNLVWDRPLDPQGMQANDGNKTWGHQNFASGFQNYKEEWKSGCGINYNNNRPCEWANSEVDKTL